MKTFTKFLLAAILAFGIQACGSDEKAANTEDSADNKTEKTGGETKKDETSKSETKTEDNSTKPDADKAGERNTAMEKKLVGTWGDRPNMAQLIFKADGKYHEITPVPEIKGTYKVIGNVLWLEGIKTMDREKDQKEKNQYTIVEIVAKKTLKLKKLPEGEYERTLRYGERLY